MRCRFLLVTDVRLWLTLSALHSSPHEAGRVGSRPDVRRRHRWNAVHVDLDRPPVRVKRVRQESAAGSVAGCLHQREMRHQSLRWDDTTGPPHRRALCPDGWLQIRRTRQRRGLTACG